MTTCQKCSHQSENSKSKFGIDLCSVCHALSPNTPEEIDEFISEKINPELLNSFRKYIRPTGESQKLGMIKKAKRGLHMSRPAFGYKFENNKLVRAENFREVEEIFEEFLNSNLSLRKLAKKHSFSVNGLKKILTNFTYVGKVKFDGEIHDGHHEAIISSILFNHVQNKIERLGLTKL